MSQPIANFIRSLIFAPTLDDERTLITDELAAMRGFAKDCPNHLKPGMIAKLLYLDTIGSDTAWGQMEVISLMTHDRASYKRIGYLAAAHMFDETNERIVLITATVQKDLSNPNTAIQRLALTLIANICTQDMAQTLAMDVIKLASSSSPIVQRCAGMAAARILQKCPELADQIRPIVAPFLNSATHSVIAVGVVLAVDLLKVDPALTSRWAHFAPQFTTILRLLFDAKPTLEFHYGISKDPFLQIRVLQILATLHNPSNELDDVLSAIVTGVDIQRNSGRSILLAAVATIGQTANKPSLRPLAFNQVGRLFTFPQPNLLYSALSMFSRILYHDSTVIERGSADSEVLQRYKSQVVQCLDHRDPSIRRRALDVVAALVDESNVESLIPEILVYLKLADRDFRAQLVAKVFVAVQRFAPSVEWNFDTVLKLLKDSGNYVGGEVISDFCKLIAQNPDLRVHAIPQLYAALRAEINTQPLIQVSAWALGEFQDAPSDIPDILIRLLSMPQTTVDTQCYLLTALAKLASRLGQTPLARPVFEMFSKHNHLEIQQRAGELLRV
jgi:hypothetical protein